MKNADKAKPEIVLNLDRARKFVFSLGALRRVEERLGNSLFKVINWKDLGFKDISILLWAGLISDDPEITQEQSDELFDLEGAVVNFAKIKDFIEVALDRAMPSLDEADREAVATAKKKLQKMAKG